MVSVEKTAAAAAGGAETVGELGGHLVLSIGQIAVLVWVRPPSVAGVRECRRVFCQLAKTSDKFGFITVVEADAIAHVPAPVRSELRELLKDYQAKIGAAAVVFEGTGFAAAIVRSVVSAIDFVLHPTYASKIHTDLATAARWMSEYVSGLPLRNVPALVETINQRRGIDRRQAKAS
jgi:hypothetical protein